LFAEWREFRDIVRRRLPTCIDPYGAESPAEFFAVLAETFVERPRRLQREDPDLYARLRDLFRLDPAAWAGQDSG
jgi:Mlc titration factor MtfA (ptsG expression regulator)